MYKDMKSKVTRYCQKNIAKESKFKEKNCLVDSLNNNPNSIKHKRMKLGRYLLF